MKIPYLAASMAIVVIVLIALTAQARDRVTTGPVIRGVSSANATTCDFSREELNGDRLAGASVQCIADDRNDSNRQKASKRARAINRLPQGFQSYCETTALKLQQEGATLITAPRRDNPEHCDLSAITPAKAQQIFGSATPR